MSLNVPGLEHSDSIIEALQHEQALNQEKMLTLSDKSSHDGNLNHSTAAAAKGGAI